MSSGTCVCPCNSMCLVFLYEGSVGRVDGWARMTPATGWQASLTTRRIVGTDIDEIWRTLLYVTRELCLSYYSINVHVPSSFLTWHVTGSCYYYISIIVSVVLQVRYTHRDLLYICAYLKTTWLIYSSKLNHRVVLIRYHTKQNNVFTEFVHLPAYFSFLVCVRAVMYYLCDRDVEFLEFRLYSWFAFRYVLN